MRPSLLPALLGLSAIGGNAAALRQRAESGCRIYLNSTETDPSVPGETILIWAIKKWVAATNMSSFTSDYCDFSHTGSAPFSVEYYADAIPGYLTDAEIAAVLDPWVGTWLVSTTSEPRTDDAAGDYNVTSVICT